MGFNVEDPDGELDFSFLDPALPLATLPDGDVATLTFTTLCDLGEGGLDAAVRFGAEPGLSFGDVSGQGIPGVGVDGGVGITSALFSDGFESSETTDWSLTIP